MFTKRIALKLVLFEKDNGAQCFVKEICTEEEKLTSCLILVFDLD